METKMKLLLALLLLIFPLVSAAAAYQWVDENGNVRFGSKPKAEKSEPAVKTEPKTPAKKPDRSSKVKTQPAATAPKVRRGKNLLLSDPARMKPATRAIAIERKKAEPVKPVLRAIPTLKPAPAPKAKTQPTPAQKAGKPPEPQPAGSTQKPARKKPVAEKAIAKKTPAPNSAAAETESGADRDKKDKDEELCGMFTNFASNYQNKLVDCQGASCTIYEKTLIKYQKKQQTYCR
ncbi:MAG TPA: DUF4124 domain-containing protein [Gammaproteobacteria bacterium]|nr:DUF4124 domain-containing protein [Gammaproteobacteria bacterium]